MLRHPMRLALAVALFLAIVTGCAMYNYPFPVQPDPDPRFDFFVVQSDDDGSFWDTKAAQGALDHVEALVKKTNTLVVLFIHGWNNNAAPGNGNLQEFKDALGGLHEEFTSQARMNLRAQFAAGSDLRIVGIYVGWRGRSLPGPLNYATFWGRKNVAEQVGRGDVSEFIERLQRIYLRTNAVTVPAGGKGHAPRAGLVTIGHSFGGQVLWQSLERLLEDPLIRRAPCMSNQLAPVPKAVGEEERIPIDGLGDLNILINPALEAYQYARVDALYRQLSYPYFQTPQVAVFSADNDDARKFWFPLARGASALFRPLRRNDNSGYQGVLYGHALGEVTDQLTHTLAKVPQPGVPDSLTESDYANPERLGHFDFTGETVFSGVRLAPVAKPAPGQAGRVANSPVLVIQTTDRIIDGHSGIFGRDFLLFLKKYISFIEAKRLLVHESVPVAESARAACATVP